MKSIVIHPLEPNIQNFHRDTIAEKSIDTCNTKISGICNKMKETVKSEERDNEGFFRRA